MTRRRRLLPNAWLGVAALALVTSRVAHAQVSAAGDVALNSQFVWRGVTSTNRFVIQPEMTVSVPIRRLTLTGGAWGNIEPVRYDGERDLSSLGGLPGPFITQSQGWAEISGTIGKRVDATFGVQGYFYPDVGNLAEYTTAELYANLSGDGFVSPSVSINHDVARIRGTYVEAGLSRAVTGERRGSVTLGATAGFSAGQAADASGRDVAYFQRDGFTHVDAAASATFTLGHVVVAPEAHMIVAYDALATVVAPDARRRAKLWFGTTLRWASAPE